MWIPGIDLRSSGLCRKGLYLISYFIGPACVYDFISMPAGVIFVSKWFWDASSSVSTLAVSHNLITTNNFLEEVQVVK